MVEFPKPGPAEREALWRLHVPSTVPKRGTIDYAALSQFELTGGQIKQAVLGAVADRLMRNGSGGKLSHKDFEEVARELVPQTRQIGFTANRGEGK